MAESNKQYFVGTVKAIFFENPENLFKIFTIKIKKTNTDWDAGDIVVTGSFGEISEEEEYRFEGHMVDHPKYGKQFQATSYKRSLPSGRKELISFFSSDEFPGIGKKKAEKIVDKLGNNAIDKILQDPHALDFLKLGEEKTNTIVEQISKNHQTEQVLYQLNNYSFGSTLSARIYQKYGVQTLEKLNDDPYQLVLDVKGVGFKRADELAKKLGITGDDPRRIKGALIQMVSLMINETGDTFVLQTELIKRVSGVLNTNSTPDLNKKLLDGLKKLVNDGVLLVEDGHVYDKGLSDSEWSIAQSLKMITDTFKGVSWTKHQFKKELKHVEKSFSVQYDKSQERAIEQSLTHSVFLLTGGPGTGKTTIINAIVSAYAKLNDATLDPASEDYAIALAAPTGRAAKHMGESTGLPAMTIHRLLGLTGTEDDEFAEPTLDCKLLIIDEMSMVDTKLFRTLIDAVQPGTQVVLVGDKDQLPSVGAGQVFSDLINSQVFPTTILKEIHRQDEDSTIIQLAHDINEGVIVDGIFQNRADRSFINCNSRNVPEVLSQIISKSSERGFDIADVQVLAPMYRGQAGIDNLNVVIQNVVNPMAPKRKEVSVGNTKYRINDKVVYLVNTPEDNVFNGEIGKIVGIILAKENTDHVDRLVIDFDGNEVTLDRKDWLNISLAYCTSIHKAQGSEFEMVILPLVNEESRMLRRNLLYTAVTRSKRLLIMVGDRQAFERSIRDQSNERQTTLKERIFASFKVKPQETVSENKDEVTEPKDYHLTLDMVMNNSIDPMIGMDNVTPYNFLEKNNA
ncbi:ATP-dependent RecD-like DNA helicase [Companilactobacillus alimentarius]|uniref:ATP-dependent RecD2 DNA helicase n=1 Tax=Companilactobacillus alimentarius DSM 20249 TaxID=1423720 RepID=A0A2K9HF52_9LACO|nr:ATP-dependent RecD-like DNA helicase [Companilactobacillus alimentarius]AUI70998.1 exodeoxyribonuclease V subunit alpha [Companilactobacillus alimentarius DSM 20249]KRK75112.1 exodeoxyribonuclease V, alpha subunit [Companilactobacillus alimentarius DSM 20249]GEO44114.1 ATP-dependent RecD-like DNA helicase [Companilactobacillus alimentarius]